MQIAMPAAPKPAPSANAIAPAPAPARAAAPDPSQLFKMPVSEAVKTASGHLAKVQTLTVGGGTKEGMQAAMTAAGLLSDTSMLVQLAHRNGIEEAKRLSPQLETNLMMLATGMAAASGQVVVAGASPKPIELKTMLAAPAKQAADVLAALVDHVSRVGTSASPSSNGYL